jgi:hypothetical protein
MSMFGSGCAVRRGFFVLRECGRTAIAVCSACARPVCAEHSAPLSAPPLCSECHARQQSTGDDTSTAWTDPAWPISYRHVYYREQNYHPVATAGGHDAYYDDYDVRSFDQEPSSEEPSSDLEEVGDAGLLDS